MDRKGFGALIAALRQDLGWTQAQLAVAADELPPAISNIERGLRKHFEPEFLFRLANALQLTPPETRELFMAASSLEDGNSGSGGGSPEFDAQGMIERLANLVEKLQLPAFLADSYSDVIAVNAAMLALFQMTPERVAELASIPAGFTAVHALYGAGMPIRQAIAAKWEEMALSSLQAFRESSLRYRATPYFKYLMRSFRNHKAHPGFERHWRRTSSLDNTRRSSMEPFLFEHAGSGWLSYYASTFITHTPLGELFLYQYLPANELTAQAFSQLLHQTGSKVYRWASWPEKTMI
jgi:transcriptional regulator with XRE-family HTH domain